MKIILSQDTPAGTYDVTNIDGSMTLTLDTPTPVSPPPPPSPPPTLPPPVVPESVQVTGTLADGTAVNLTLSPGQRLPMGKDATAFRERIRKAYRRASLRRAELKWSELPVVTVIG